MAFLFGKTLAPKFAPAPLDAVKVFFGGDDWFTLFAQPLAPPQQSKHNPNKNTHKLPIVIKKHITIQITVYN